MINSINTTREAFDRGKADPLLKMCHARLAQARLILSIMREGSLTRSNGILSKHQRNSMR